MRHKTFLAKRSMSIDLEYGMFRIEEGKTYTDDGTTIYSLSTSAMTTLRRQGPAPTQFS